MSPALPAQATAAEQQKTYFRLEQGDDNAAIRQCWPKEISCFILFATSWQVSSRSMSRLQNTNGEIVHTEPTTVCKAQA